MHTDRNASLEITPRGTISSRGLSDRIETPMSIGNAPLYDPIKTHGAPIVAAGMSNGIQMNATHLKVRAEEPQYITSAVPETIAQAASPSVSTAPAALPMNLDALSSENYILQIESNHLSNTVTPPVAPPQEKHMIAEKLQRGNCFVKRKKGLMKKLQELAILSGAEVFMLIRSETGKIYTQSTAKFAPITNSEEGIELLTLCLSGEHAQLQNSSKAEEQNANVEGENYMRLQDQCEENSQEFNFQQNNEFWNAGDNAYRYYDAPEYQTDIDSWHAANDGFRVVRGNENGEVARSHQQDFTVVSENNGGKDATTQPTKRKRQNDKQRASNSKRTSHSTNTTNTLLNNPANSDSNININTPENSLVANGMNIRVGGRPNTINLMHHNNEPHENAAEPLLAEPMESRNPIPIATVDSVFDSDNGLIHVLTADGGSIYMHPMQFYQLIDQQGSIQQANPLQTQQMAQLPILQPHHIYPTHIPHTRIQVRSERVSSPDQQHHEQHSHHDIDNQDHIHQQNPLQNHLHAQPMPPHIQPFSQQQQQQQQQILQQQRMIALQTQHHSPMIPQHLPQYFPNSYPYSNPQLYYAPVPTFVAAPNQTTPMPQNHQPTILSPNPQTTMIQQPNNQAPMMQPFTHNVMYIPVPHSSINLSPPGSH